MLKYSESTQFTFPADMEGLPHTVIETKSYVDFEAMGNGDVIHRVLKKQHYVWLGNDLVASGKPIVLKSKIKNEQ